tara:strand:- start:142 stop:729 length:588 start_codon:yes stop_codon:yes gene_type:complete
MNSLSTASGFLEAYNTFSNYWLERDQVGLKSLTVEVFKPIFRLLSKEQEFQVKEFTRICLSFGAYEPDGIDGCSICHYGMAIVEFLSILPNEPPKVRALVWVSNMAQRADHLDTGADVLEALEQTAENLEDTHWMALAWALWGDQAMGNIYTPRRLILGYFTEVDKWLQTNQFNLLKAFNEDRKGVLKNLTGGVY